MHSVVITNTNDYMAVCIFRELCIPTQPVATVLLRPYYNIISITTAHLTVSALRISYPRAIVTCQEAPVFILKQCFDCH